MKLSVCMILGRCDEKLLDTFASIDPIADEICLLQTVEDEATHKLIEGFDFTATLNHQQNETLMHDDGFLRSFADARNESFEMATGDMILWIDADDVISNPANLREAVETLNAQGVDYIRMDYDYEFDENGQCTTRHQRERVVRNGYFEWIAPIHEVLSPKRRAGTQDLSRNCAYIIHNNARDDDNTSRQERNVKMLERIVREGGDQRMKMYYGNSLFDIGRHDEAIAMYKEYLSESKWEEERYQVMIRIHNVYRKQNKLESAKAWCLKAIELFPKYNQAFLALGEIECIKNEWERALHWMALYGQCVPVESGMIHNPVGDEIQPLLILQKCYHETGDFERALTCTDQLRELVPHNKETWDAVSSHCLKQLNDLDLVKCYEKILLNTPEEDHQKIYDAVPNSIADYPAFKKHKKKVRPDSKKVVSIYCGYDETQSWGPESIKKGIGGSEEAVINVSREFVELGWTVEVYCNCTNEGNIDGVNWYQADAANQDDTVDLSILWRHPHHVYNAPRGFVTWLWNHDLQDNMEPYYDEDTMSRIDKVMFLSKFHRATAPWVDEDKCFYTTNGVDKALVASGDNDPYTAIYASSPDRGLDTLLDMWPEISNAHPKARLKVFYGFNKWFDMRYANDKGMMEWKARLLDQMETDPTITYYGSVGQDVLAKEIASSGTWLYPTTFGETSCITAMKMQCGGAVPVTTNYGALHDTVVDGHKMGEALEPIFDKAEFLRTAISVIGNKEHQNAIRTGMIPRAKMTFGWDAVAKEWNAEYIKCSNKNMEKVES